MSDLFGGFEPAIEAITEMRTRVLNELEPSEPTTVGETFLKDDGVNLTPEGEAELAKIVYDSHGNANVKVKMESANAEVLTQESDPEAEPDPITAIRLEEDLETITGYEADEIGRKVEAAAEGQLEDEEEVDDFTL
jgi:hypothetical protein